jgi:ethanolaminephosphotransferase
MTLLWGLTPIFCYYACMYLWVSAEASRILQDHLILFLVTLGIFFGRMTTQMSLHRILDADYPFFTLSMIPLALGALLVRTPILNSM